MSLSLKRHPWISRCLSLKQPFSELKTIVTCLYEARSQALKRTKIGAGESGRTASLTNYLPLWQQAKNLTRSDCELIKDYVCYINFK